MAVGEFVQINKQLYTYTRTHMQPWPKASGTSIFFHLSEIFLPVLFPTGYWHYI